MNLNGKTDPLTADYIKQHGDRCAWITMGRGQKIRYCILAAALLILLKYRWDYFMILTSAVLMLIYGGAAWIRMGSALLSLLPFGEIRVKGSELIPAGTLPIYTILVPLYRESAVAEKILRRIDALDYPKDRLDVKLLLECDDQETRAAFARQPLPPYCEVIEVPDGFPRTKPRACNYGLRAAQGEFCVIYDAEDAPEQDQLRKVLAAFRRNDTDGKLLCVQAKLNYYNADQNWLTKFFTVEYSTYFDLTLGGLQSFRLPIPLGGTSNHFKTKELREIGGWDPFNVTEDCDLGIRIYEAGMRTILVNSTTWEEANSKPYNWLRQRSRWVKGFLQTHLVHFRRPLDPVKRLGLRGAAGCYLLVGGSVLMMLLNLIYWPVILIYLLLLIHGVAHGESLTALVVGPHTGADPYRGITLGNGSIRAWPLIYSGPTENVILASLSKVFFAAGAFLFLTNLMLILIHAAACVKRGFYRLIPWAFLMPFYWVMISLGAWKGLIQLLTNPFYWEKTIHGLDGAEKK